MKLEHVALLVADPVAVARWYGENLGLRTLRSAGAPGFGHFLADETGAVALEVYTGENVPDYAAMDPALLHVGFATADLPATREKLLAAGATAVGDVVVTPAGDRFAMLRDPWGLAVQLACRARPLAG